MYAGNNEDFIEVVMNDVSRSSAKNKEGEKTF